MSAAHDGLSKARDAYGIRWRTGKTKCCASTEVAGHEITSNNTEEIGDGQQTVIFQETGLLDHVSKTNSCPFIYFSGNLRFRSSSQSRQILKMYFKGLFSFQMHTNRVFNGLRLIETSTQSLLHPEGVLPENLGGDVVTVSLDRQKDIL